MKTESRVLIGIVAVVLMVLTLTGGVLAAQVYAKRFSQTVNVQNREDLNQFMANIEQGYLKERIAIWFFKEARAVTLNGTIVTYFNGILIIDVGGKRLNILLPPRWTVDSNVINRSAILSEEYVRTGDNVIVKALQRNATNKQDVTINILVAYELTDTTNGNQLYVILPFNIDS